MRPLPGPPGFASNCAAPSLFFLVGFVTDGSGWGAGVLDSSSSVRSSRRNAVGVFAYDSVSPRTCCNEVLGSTRMGDDACVVMRSSSSECSIVEFGDAPSYSAMVKLVKGQCSTSAVEWTTCEVCVWYAGALTEAKRDQKQVVAMET